VYDAMVLLAIAASALSPARRFTCRLPARLRDALGHPLTLPLALLALCAAQHAYFALMLDASYHQRPDYAFLQRMPVRIINDTGGANHIAPAYGDRFAGLALLESLALAAIYHALVRPRPWQLALVAIVALGGCAEALVVRAGTNADMYSYVGFTLLGGAAYTPPAVAFAGAFAVINAWWGTPLIPAPYGPVWLHVASAIAGLAPTLYAKIVALRLLGAGALLGVVAGLAALRFPPRSVALVALNPALVLEFVTNVHNDLFAVVLVLGARVAATRGAILPAIALAVLAALVKLPFLLFAALAFVPIVCRRKRVAAYLAATACALAISWLWGGPAYLAALLHHADEHTTGHALALLSEPGALLKIAALAGIAIAFLSDTWFEGIAWALPTVGVTLFPWYLCWSLPYAVASKEMLRNVAIALPLVTFATDKALGNGEVSVLLQVALYGWLTVSCARLMIARRRMALARAT